MSDDDFEQVLRGRLHERARGLHVEHRLGAVRQELELLDGAGPDGLDEVEVLDIGPPGDRRPGVGSRVAVLASVLLALGGLVGLLVAFAGGDEPGGGGDGDVTALDVAGPYDGLESIGLPVSVVPDVGLTDGQEVIVSGAGFTPFVQLGVVQCLVVTDGSGSIDDCDIGNYQLTAADENGNFSLSMPVRRFISNSRGEHDCAQGGIELSCGIAAGNLSDYDESGTTRTFFDPEVDGVRAPLLQVEPGRGLIDGTEITVSGENFVPGERVRLTQCVLNNTGIDLCFSSNPTHEAVPGDDGTFVVQMAADRFVDSPVGEIDCLGDPYGCRVVAAGQRIPNPVELFYDGGERLPPGPDYRVSPSSDLVDGELVHVEITDFGGSDGAEFVARQCVDLLLPEVACGDPVVGVVTGGAIGFDLAVTQFVLSADGSLIDCAQPGRVCYVTVEAADYTQPRLPLRFAPEVSE